MKDYKWIEPRNDEYREQKVRVLVDALGISPLFAEILVTRNLSDPKEAEDFLHPNLATLSKPQDLPGANVIGDLLAMAVTAKKRILVYGDYDVDGVTAASTLYHALKFFGADVEVYVPSRSEGYGISGETAEKIILSLRPAIIVTVDCGITGIDAAEVCKKWGVDFLVTDHHDGKAELPDAAAICHPRALGKSPAPDLCGAGVAWKVAWSLGQHMNTPNPDGRVSKEFALLLRDLLAFTALGTIADVVSLRGENRTIVKHGLEALINQQRFVGLYVLLEHLSMNDRVDGYDVGWTIAPRINAVGRMEHAQEAVRLFTEANAQEAKEIVLELDRLNRLRQQVERDNVKEAIAQAEKMGERAGYIVYNPDWYKGTVGLVAGKVAQHFLRPCIALRGHGEKDGIIGGSGRSVPGFNVRGALEANEHLLGHFGGHEAACGVNLHKDNLDAFREAFNTYCTEHLDPEAIVPKVIIDADCYLPDLTVEIVESIRELGPFGQSNRSPLLICRDIIPRYLEPTKDGKHLRFKAQHGGRAVQCMWWGNGANAHNFPDGRYDLVAEPQINEWKGNRSVQLIVRDMKPSA